MEVELIKLTISLLYGIPSFVLYIVILIQIVRPKYRKTFSNAFFRLFSAIGFVDCLGYLTYYTFFTLPMYSITSPIFGSSLFAPSAFTTGIYFSLFMSGYLQIFGNCFLTVNRFTAIVFPLRHDKIWRALLPISVVTTIIISIAPCWQVSTATALYVPLQSDSPQGGYGIMLEIPNPDIPFILFISIFVTCALCLFLNAISATVLVFRKNVGSNRKVERNFFLAALIIFMVQSLHGIHEVLFFIGTSTENSLMVAIMNSTVPWLMDLKFLSPPWILLFFSASIRETVIKALPKRFSSNLSAPVVSLATRS
ncbi:hypothetical protein QR680_008502 [Steinernema hermaphroditum]|uniref:Serpentine receptor class gamma n=1 Tax=Steinernema hermaphroditum TaxID=289476 RepID=A0AA39IJ20_9BILA|nr:hypothetical protein QR680_008502 [Steinernema hermaphroditum]